MIENILFYGFVSSASIYGILTFLTKYILKINGYQVTLINIDLSDYKNLHSLTRREKKYRFLYFAYILLTVIPLSLVIAIVITMVHE
jgi:hypothetical protein